MAGEDPLRWLVIGPIVIRMARQARAEIRVAGREQGPPPRFKMPGLERRLRSLVMRLLVAKQVGMLMVDQRRMWGEHDQLAGPVCAQAEIDIAVDHRIRL